MQHMASFGILLRKEDRHPQENTETGYVEGDLLPVHKAAADGDINNLVRIIQEDPSLLEQHSAEGVTPLGQAVLCQQMDTVKKLIKMGANIDAQDNVGRTCLSIATYQGWHSGVVCLLRNGAKQCICDKSGRYPLHAATYHSDISTMTILLNGLTKKEVNFPDHEMMTAVHWAAFHDRPEHLMQLIQKGGDVLARDVDGKLPLHWAAQNGSFQCTHRLISLTEGLAMVNDVDSSGKSPAHYAAAAGSANILKIIERCETADMEMEDPDERTPLHWAAAMGHANAVETLLKLGVNPNPHDIDGYTPLDYAIQTGSKDCVKVIETHVGHTTTGVKEKKKYQLSHEDLQRRPGQPSSSDQNTASGPAAAHQEGGVPAITVQAPTTTVSKATSNPGAVYPRMYSASTDTDAPAYKVQASATPPETPITSRQIKYNYKESPTVRWARENAQGGALSKLIGASFLTGAQAPILHAPEEQMEGREVGVESPRQQKRARPPKEQVISPRGAAELVSGLDLEQEDESKWATVASGHEHDVTADASADTNTDRPELQIKTSGNTPDLQRVSVQSFRSVPPIPASSGKAEINAARPPIDRTKGLRLQGARLTPLPGITPKSNTPVEEPWPEEEVLTPRKMNELEPLAPLRGPHRVLDEDVQPPVTNRANVPPVDFMTENNAETRILTKKYNNTLARFYDVSLKQQGAATATSSASNIPQASKRSQSTSNQAPHANKQKPAGAYSRQSAGYKDTASIKFFKHSRIPSTRIGAHHPDSTNATGVTSTGAQDASVASQLQVPRRKGHQKSTTILSSAGVFRTSHEKYLREDEDNDPPSPTPLANYPAAMLAATFGGRRRAAPDRLLGNSETSRKKVVEATSSRHKQQQQQEQQQQQQSQQQQQQHYPGHTTAGGKVTHVNASKKSVNFMMDPGGGSRNQTYLQSHHNSHTGKQAGPAESGRGKGGVSGGGARVHMPALRQANLVRSKN